MNKRTVLLTGASGSMGKSTFLELLARRDELRIRLLLRPSSVNRKAFAPYVGMEGVELIWGDLGQAADVRRAVHGADIILHPAAMVSPAADHNPEAARRANVVGTANLLDAVRAEPEGVDRIRFVYVASVAQYGDRLPPREWIRVGDPVKPSVHDYYALTKCAAERSVIESGLKHWASLRQTYIAVPDATTMMDPILFHQPLDTRMELITGNDAGHGLMRCVDASDAFWGRIYNMSGGPSCRITYADYMERTFRTLGIGDYQNVFDRNWFALRNFHCGFFADSADLNEQLGHFRETTDDHLEQLDRAFTGWKRRGVGLCPETLMRLYMKRLADPLKWIRANDQARVEAFFGSRDVWEAIPGWDGAPVNGSVSPDPYIEPEHEKPPPRAEEMTLDGIRSFAESRGGRCLSEQALGAGARLDWICAREHRFEASPRLLVNGGYWCPECEPSLDDTSGWDYERRCREDPLLARVC